MTNFPQPNQPHQPHYWPHRGPPVDPQNRCRRAGILLFVVGMLVALYGIWNFTLAYTMSPDALLQVNQQNMQSMGGMPQAQISAEALRTLMFVVSALIVLIGLSLMILSGPVRRASRPMSMTALVIVGLVGGFCALFTFLGVLMGLAAPPMLMLACCFSVPLAVTVWMFVWLLQAYRAAGFLEQSAHMPPGYDPRQPYQQLYGQYPSPPQYPPTSTPAPPMSGPPSFPPVPPGPSFGPAPFGIPPPPDDAGGKYGYATKPREKPSDESTESK